MKFTGYKHVSLSSLRFDIPEIKRRTKEAHVTELAATIREFGDEPIHALTVRAESRLVICGRDRLAALMLLKAKKTWVHLADCTDAEAADLEAIENVHRRADNRAEVLARAVAAKEAALASQWGTDVPPTQRVKAAARKAVARAAGVSPAAVKKAEQRANRDLKGSGAAETPSSARRESEASSPVSSHGDPSGTAEALGEDVQPLTLDLLGIDDSSVRAVMKFARKDQDAIDEADKHLRLAQTALARMTVCTPFQELRADVHRVASRVRSLRPAFLCPWCKGLPRNEVQCQPCLGLGYVPHDVAGRAPREARENDEPIVLIDGKAIPYVDFRQKHEDQMAKFREKAKAKQVAVEMPDGRTLEEHEAEANEAY
jgi:ParB-like chromosome segregation protein Spo0J